MCFFGFDEWILAKNLSITTLFITSFVTNCMSKHTVI